LKKAIDEVSGSDQKKQDYDSSDEAFKPFFDDET
jgi:hypothetical protein